MVWGEKEVVNELRNGLRVRQQIPVKWSIKNTNLNGEGRILNISTSGVLLETQNVLASERAVFNIESVKANGFKLPQESRLVWSKTKGIGNNRRLCGLEFVEPKEESVSHLREKIQKGIMKRAALRRWQSIVGVILTIVMLALSALTVWQYMENSENTKQAYQLLSGSYDRQLSLTQMYAQELAETKELLVQAQADLAAAKTEIGQLTDKNVQFEATIAQLQEQSSRLTDENTRLTGEMVTLKERLNFLEGDVKNLEEAKRLIAEYKGKFRLVKAKIRVFNREAYEAKKAAQQERDRVASLLGNNGYLVRDGKPHISNAAAAGQGSEAAPSVNINVEITK